MSKMLSFKGTKGKDLKTESIKNTKLKTEFLDTISNLNSKPNLPPAYTDINKDHSHLITYPQIQETKSVSGSKLLSEITSKTSTNNGVNEKNDIMKITSTINLVFDRDSGHLKEITSMMYDDIDIGYLPQKFNIPIPELIKWLNKSHIMLYSRKNIGSLLIVESKQFVDEYPDCISCILFEKVNKHDNFDIKVVVNLKYENRYITKSELLDVIYVNINNFWIIIKKDNNIHLLYYYKIQKDDLLNKSKNNSDYVYTEFILEYYTFICSMWTIYDLSPDVIYLAVHDEYKNVSLHQYTIVNDTKTNLPEIELYSVDTRLIDCGTYLSYCVNYNISIFTILLELENKDKHFYTGMMSLSQIDSDQKTKVKLEFSKTIINTKLNIYEAQFMIYTIMKKTEESINIEEAKKNEAILNNYKKIMADKDLEKAKKEMERRDLEAKANADKLLAEEDSKKNKKIIKINKDKQRLEKEKLAKKRLEKEKLERLEKEKLDKEKLERLEKEIIKKIILENERLDKEKLENERLEKERLERLEKEKLESLEILKKEKLLQLKRDEERIKKEKLQKDKLQKEQVKKTRIEKEKFEKERLEILKLEKKIILQNNLEKEKKEKVKRIEKDNLEQELLVQEKLDQEKLDQEKLVKEEELGQTDLLQSNSIKKPLYYISNEIELTYTQYSLYFMFIHNMSMINPIVANEIAFSQSKIQYNQVLFKHRFYVMYALDMLIINSLSIYEIKKMMDKNKDKDFSISAIYGSVLPILYSILLNDLAFEYNVFGKNIKPLDKLKDYDTLELKLLHDYNETHTDNEFIREASMLIGYHTDDKPVTRTKIQSSSIHNLICKCWDLNYTSAILLFEDNHQPYIKRHPDFTEFLFGQQPIQLLFGKNETNLYDYKITMNRLKKALQVWY